MFFSMTRLLFWEEIIKWLDEGSTIVIIYLDFHKAFYKMSHQTLLLELKAHGIGDGIFDWIEQWLTYRTQRVVIDGGGFELEISFEWGTTRINTKVLKGLTMMVINNIYKTI